MKKLKYVSILAIFALLSVVNTWAQQAGDGSMQPSDFTLVIWHKDGSQVKLKLIESPKIEYVGDSVIIKSTETLRYGFKDIRKMTYVLKSPIKGDANGDGTVNTADIVEVVNYIMGYPSGKFDGISADINDDGTINIADIVAIANIIMRQ